jgi:hypothetical protein
MSKIIYGPAAFITLTETPRLPNVIQNRSMNSNMVIKAERTITYGGALYYVVPILVMEKALGIYSIYQALNSQSDPKYHFDCALIGSNCCQRVFDPPESKIITTRHSLFDPLLMVYPRDKTSFGENIPSSSLARAFCKKCQTPIRVIPEFAGIYLWKRIRGSTAAYRFICEDCNDLKFRRRRTAKLTYAQAVVRGKHTFNDEDAYAFAPEVD